jgi:hypothetical protein
LPPTKRLIGLPSSSSPRPRKAVTYTLERDGNGVERKYWTLFARDEFPSYEALWREYIVPLTMRPDHPNFESDEALAKMGRGPEDMGNAQLHCTTFTHLTRVFDLKEAGFSTADQFIEALVRLAAATDVADELLQRATNPSKYAPWSEKDGREARNDWRKAHGYPLREIRGYRKTSRRRKTSWATRGRRRSPTSSRSGGGRSCRVCDLKRGPGGELNS